MTRKVGIDDIKAAANRIAGRVYRTPLLRAEALDELFGAEVFLKPENLQKTGSFKVRGAMNALLSLSEEGRARGVVAASSGNHAQGVAYAARLFGVNAVLVLPENAPRAKIDGTRALGADVVLYGTTVQQRYERAHDIQAQKGYTLIHSYDDPDLIAGQATCGLELIEDLPVVDTVVVPLGGGGLLAGVATAVKESSPSSRVVGVEPEKIRRYAESRNAGRAVEITPGESLADGLKITAAGRHNYPLIEKYVDEIVFASDVFIRRALAAIVFKGRLLAEPSACVGVAAAFQGSFKVKRGERICFLLSGGNMDPGKLLSLLSCGQE